MAGHLDFRDLTLLHFAYPSGSTHVSMKGAWGKIDFATGIFDVQFSNTVNLPIDGALTNAILTPATPPVGGGTDVYLLLVEFFQMVNAVQYSLKNGAFNALSIVEVS